MSNTMNTPPTIRRQLLSTVSALALLGSAYTAQAASSDADHPLLWIELGGQMENVSGQGEIFAPAFLAANPNSPVLNSVTPLQAQKPPKFSFGEEARISFQPEGSDWVFSASARLGRSSNFRHVHHQTDATHPKYFNGVPLSSPGATVADFADTQAKHRENHAVLDFLAGKDVGLGILGSGSSSTLSFGVRFAQFASKAAFDIRARPDLDISYKYAFGGAIKKPQFYFHTYHATGDASRSFRGIGPSISWNGSTPFAGDAQSGEIAFDWGINAALLFGRQKTNVKHNESGRYYNGSPNYYKHYTAGYLNPVGGRSNTRSVAIPNVGGMAGISFRHGDAKVSFGYRADFFLGAVDGGIDARKSETLGFKGPFASISIGLGD